MTNEALFLAVKHFQFYLDPTVTDFYGSKWFSVFLNTSITAGLRSWHLKFEATVAYTDQPLS